MPGRVFKRGKIYWIGFSHKGREYRASAKTESKREAENVLSHYLGQCARGEFKGFTQDTVVTLDDLLTLTLDAAEIRELRSISHMRFRAEHLKRFLGAHTPVEQITEETIAKYVVARRKKDIKLSTINRELQVLKQSFRLARKRRLIQEIAEIEKFPEHNVRMVFFEPDVFETVQAHLSDVVRDMARFAYLTGWRKTQIARLEWRDVHNGVIRLSGKTVKHKDVQVLSLTGELAAIIERRRAAQHPDSPWVFHHGGKPYRNFRATWERALEQAGVSDYHFHDLCRTATRNMALAGVPEKHIMQVTGHKTRYMLDRYNITVERDTHETLERTQAYLNRKHGQKTDTNNFTEE